MSKKEADRLGWEGNCDVGACVRMGECVQAGEDGRCAWEGDGRKGPIQVGTDGASWFAESEF